MNDLLKKLIDEINEAKFASLHYLEDCELFNDVNPTIVQEGLDVEKHRWYETSTTVFKVGDLFLGVNGASQCYSESSSWDDLFVNTTAFEMEEVKTVTYKRVNH